MLNVIVCVKAVPDPSVADKIKIDPVTKSFPRSDIPLVINPLDRHEGDPRGCVFKIVIKDDPDGDGNTIVSLVLPVPSRY